MTMHASCELCDQVGGALVFESEKLRVVMVDDPHYPGFCRVIWNEHAQEMTDLSQDERDLFTQVVWQVEAALREVMHPTKVNIASLGNVVPHLHWHVIPRFSDDAHFPSPIWSDAKRVTAPEVMAARKALLPKLCISILQYIE
jgi:diadenosine tetraphosphate (Ap4A) HIT family hydrolase